ncbi:MAG: methionyl-tRNA formyltransferase [Defluviitaleaceae bacterium]|nr:methionyl-tRNA formyltransferase [Defluviitaleaceae bacterium]
MKTVFMGTPEFAAESLRALLTKHDVAAVCTQPDRPAGRGHKLQESPVKSLAASYGIPVLQPETLRLADSKEIRDQLRNYGADIFVVAAYGLILPKGVLEMPALGCINVHASLLPKYRGASPIHSVLLNGDTETGITIIQMDAGIDTGDMILKKSLPVFPEENFGEIHDRLAKLGGEVLLESLRLLEAGTATKTPQEHSLSSHSPMIKKADGKINWADTNVKILNQIRALGARPGCFTLHKGQPLKIHRAQILPVQNLQCLPGTVLEHNGIAVKTGDGALLITELQATGKKRMPATDFLRGQKIDVGEVFS